MEYGYLMTKAAKTSTARTKTNRAKTTSEPKVDRFAEMTAKFVDMIKSGAADPNGWRMPWNTLTSSAPRNIESGKAYQGVNYLVLSITATEANGPALFATFPQMVAKHLSVRKGEKATWVVKYFPVERKGPDGKPVLSKAGKPETWLSSTAYPVFGIWQVDDAEGFEGAKARQLDRFGYSADGTRAAANAADVSDDAEAFFGGLNADVRFGHGQAFYSSNGDFIAMPARDQFAAGEAGTLDYYTTLGHEHTHRTGTAGRLDRPSLAKYNETREDRAMEELIAELGAAFTLNTLFALPTTPRQDHADYLASWVEVLSNDPKALVHAASKAHEAFRWMVAQSGCTLDSVAEVVDDTEAPMLAMAAA